MTDYGHDILFGAFITPSNDPPQHAVDMALAAERAGLDLATFQDHPYQPRFHDTWTLLSYVAARTGRIRLSANVHNLPLRPPAVLARAAASLDLLSGGRFELALGAGGFWDAIEAMGGRRLGAGESILALEEAIGIIRGIWNPDDRSPLRVDGEHYGVNGAKRGPKPAHDMSIWVGAYGPRISRMTGRVADGVLPSLARVPNGAAGLAEINRNVDEGARSAGRDPGAVRRLLNVPGSMSAEELAELALAHGVSVFIGPGDDARELERFGAEVAPAVRELVAVERKGRQERAAG